MDSKSESAISEALDTLLTDKTTLIIAHRISTIKNADQIIVLQDGTVSGVGTHKELINENTLYRSLAQKQLSAS